METRVEYLTLAVGNAKSHPVSAGGRHETAIAFLTDLEEKLDVAQVQLEIYNTLASRANEHGETGMKIQKLSKTLLNITEVCMQHHVLFARIHRCFIAVSILCRAFRPANHEVAYLPYIWTQR